MKFGLVTSLASLTDRYQTTVPEPVRQALNLHKRDKIRFIVDEGGQVLLERADEEVNDPAMMPFLDMLERDIAARPQAIRPVTEAMLAEIDALVGDDEIDLDAAYVADEE